MANSIERRGIDQVISSYRLYADNGSPMYSVWSGTELRFSYKGDDVDAGEDLLRQNLEFIKQSGTNTNYKIRLYSDIDGKITNKTPYEASFTFNVNEHDPDLVPYNQYPRPGQFAIASPMGGALAQELAEIKATLAGLQEQEPEPSDAISRFMQTVNKILENPVAEDLCRGIIKKMGIPIDEEYSRVTSAAGTGEIATEAEVTNAFNILCQHDPDFPTVLIKLSRLIQENRPMYDTAKSMLQ